MVDRSAIREHMDVVAADGTTIGKVDSVDGDRIKIARHGSPDGQHHHVPLAWVSRVDEHVHLDRGEAAVLAADGARGTAAAATIPGRSRSFNWLPWLIGGIALLALILALSQCDNDKNDADDVAGTAQQEEVVTPAVAGAPLTSGTLAYDLDRFLASSDGTPRTFTFEKLNFDSGKATIRAGDEKDLDDIARVFAGYPKARAAVVGYTDSQGAAASNRELGGDRARAVIAALGARGVAADRFEARTGGEDNPDASNANASGRFENRRTELIILKR